MAAPPCIDPELEQPVEEQLDSSEGPKPPARKRRLRELLIAIFEGHEEFLGWTPD